MKVDIDAVFHESIKFLATQARELICVNVSDMSGTRSKTPHTVLAATYLTGCSLRVISRNCILATQDILEQNGAKVLNYACDGESLHLATLLPDGTPGTEVSLLKEINTKLKSFPKKKLVKLIAENSNINLSRMTIDCVEEDLLDLDANDQYCVENIINKSIDVSERPLNEQFSEDDIEAILLGNNIRREDDIESRRIQCMAMKVAELRAICLEEVFPSLRDRWLTKTYGKRTFTIIINGDKFSYCPSTVFFRSKEGYFTTITFDPAHIANLLREGAAKGKLSELGLTRLSLEQLSKLDGYSYLKKIISLKNGNLEYDPMNQVSSAALFSLKSEKGLERIGDNEGARCCKLLREGIIESMDVSGISSMDRCLNIINLKMFLLQKIKAISKISKPTPDEISSELYQMIQCTLDSFIVSYINMEFFNPRRKSTGTVEQFFSQITLMNDGGRKLSCRVLSDLIQRVMITNSLRLIPISVKGFSFLGELKQHMTSYNSYSDEDEGYLEAISYPIISKWKDIILPRNSPFDIDKKKKRKIYLPDKDTTGSCVSSNSNVRKFTRKF